MQHGRSRGNAAEVEGVECGTIEIGETQPSYREWSIGGV